MPKFQTSLPIASYSTFKDYVVLGGGEGIRCCAVFHVFMRNAALFPLGARFGRNWQGLSLLMIPSAFFRTRPLAEHIFHVESRESLQVSEDWRIWYRT